MKIQVDVNTTNKDYSAFQRHHILRYIWIYAVLGLVAGVLLGLLIADRKTTGVFNEILTACFFIVMAAFLYLIVNAIITMAKTAKLENKKPVFSYTFTKGGVNCRSNGKSFDLAWTKVYRVKEIRSMFLIYTDKQNAFIVPKRCFANESDISEFRDNLLFEPRKNEKTAPSSKKKVNL